MENRDKKNKHHISEGINSTPENINESTGNPGIANPKRAEIKPTNKTIVDFQDDTNLKEDEDQITDQGGSMGTVPPGYRDDQDRYA